MFNLSKSEMKILHAKYWFKVERYDESYTDLIVLDTNLWSRWAAVRRAIWVQAAGCWVFVSPSAIFRGTEPVSGLTRAPLFCCTLYVFTFLSFVISALAMTGFHLLTWTGFQLLTWPSDVHCFGALGVGPGARTPQMGSDYSEKRGSRGRPFNCSSPTLLQIIDFIFGSIFRQI